MISWKSLREYDALRVDKDEIGQEIKRLTNEIDKNSHEFYKEAYFAIIFEYMPLSDKLKKSLYELKNNHDEVEVELLSKRDEEYKKFDKMIEDMEEKLIESGMGIESGMEEEANDK